MIILDKNGDVVESPDYDKGRVESQEMKVVHCYVVDTEEQGHWETVNEYPETGGADVEWRIDVPEVGHWETVDSRGKPVEHYDGDSEEWWPKDCTIEGTWYFMRYVEYTPEELDDIARQKAEAEAQRVRSEQMQAAVLSFVMSSAADMSDEDAQDVSMLFAEWQVGASYKTRDICSYQGGLYRILQDVPSAQADHTPDKAVSLYKKIGEPTGGLFPWSQPQGAHDAYKKGDKVSHNGKTWVSTVDSNVLEPGVYGWKEAKE